MVEINVENENTKDRLTVDRASIAKECEQCDKKERYNVIQKCNDTAHPARLLLTDDLNCVLVRESCVSEPCYLLFKCTDMQCLLSHMKSTVAFFWMQEQQRKYMMMQKQTRKKKRKK